MERGTVGSEMERSGDPGPEHGVRAKDLLGVPGLLSLSRLPLAAAFFALETEPVLRLLVLVLAGVSDVLDGWYARRTERVTQTGAVLDPITDKLFVLTVATTLVLENRLEVSEVLLLGARELGEAPLVLWLLVSRSARRAVAESAVANRFGKSVTVLQFVAVALALFHDPAADVAIWATACVGVLAAFVYWRRSLATRRKAFPA